jgi:hypothetical protein
LSAGGEARNSSPMPVLIEDAEAAQLRYQSPKQFRPDRNEQRYHKPDYQSHHCAGSYSAPKYLLFAGRHFNLPKASETLRHPGSTVAVQTIISPVSYKARASHVKRPKIQTETPSQCLTRGTQADEGGRALIHVGTVSFRSPDCLQCSQVALIAEHHPPTGSSRP